MDKKEKEKIEGEKKSDKLGDLIKKQFHSFLSGDKTPDLTDDVELDCEDRKTITSTETDSDVMERVYHLKEIKELLDEVLEDYINQASLMNDKELSYDRNEWMRTIGREKYDDKELERHSQIHTVSIELEQIRRFGGIVYDYEE